MTRQNRLCFARLENKADALENNGKEIASPLSPLKGGLRDLQAVIVFYIVFYVKNNVKHKKTKDYVVPSFREVPVGRRFYVNTGIRSNHGNIPRNILIPTGC